MKLPARCSGKSPSCRADLDVVLALRRVTQDIKACYHEAVAAVGCGRDAGASGIEEIASIGAVNLVAGHARMACKPHGYCLPGDLTSRKHGARGCCRATPLDCRRRNKCDWNLSGTDH